MKYSNSGTAVCNFTIAVNAFKKDDPPDWIRITMFGKTAEIAAQYLRKGSKVAVEASLKPSNWDDPKTGEKRYRTDVIANRFHFLDSKGSKDGDGQPAQQATKAVAPQGGEPNFDDVPF